MATTTVTTDFRCVQDDPWLPECPNRVTVQGALCLECAHGFDGLVGDGVSRGAMCACGETFTVGDPEDTYPIDERYKVGTANEDAARSLYEQHVAEMRDRAAA